MARLREFDEDAVLNVAADEFWKGGFEATSTRDLTSSMGLTPSSLYMAFGSKRELFRQALDNYLQRTLREKVARLEAMPDPALAITIFFHDIIERSLDDTERRGCLLVNSIFEASAGNDSLKLGITQELVFIERFFLGRLQAAQSATGSRARTPLDDVARHLLSVLLGVRVLARIRPEEALLKGAVSEALKAAALPPLPDGPTELRDP